MTRSLTGYTNAMNRRDAAIADSYMDGARLVDIADVFHMAEDEVRSVVESHAVITRPIAARVPPDLAKETPAPGDLAPEAAQEALGTPEITPLVQMQARLECLKLALENITKIGDGSQTSTPGHRGRVMAEFPYFRFWTDAYLADTTHLTTIEHDAYQTDWRRLATEMEGYVTGTNRVPRERRGQAGGVRGGA